MRSLKRVLFSFKAFFSGGECQEYKLFCVIGIFNNNYGDTFNIALAY